MASRSSHSPSFAQPTIGEMDGAYLDETRPLYPDMVASSTTGVSQQLQHTGASSGFPPVMEPATVGAARPLADTYYRTRHPTIRFADLVDDGSAEDSDQELVQATTSVRRSQRLSEEQIRRRFDQWMERHFRRRTPPLSSVPVEQTIARSSPTRETSTSFFDPNTSSADVEDLFPRRTTPVRTMLNAPSLVAGASAPIQSSLGHASPRHGQHFMASEPSGPRSTAISAGFSTPVVSTAAFRPVLNVLDAQPVAVPASAPIPATLEHPFQSREQYSAAPALSLPVSTQPSTVFSAPTVSTEAFRPSFYTTNVPPANVGGFAPMPAQTTYAPVSIQSSSVAPAPTWTQYNAPPTVFRAPVVSTMAARTDHVFSRSVNDGIGSEPYLHQQQPISQEHYLQRPPIKPSPGLATLPEPYSCPAPSFSQSLMASQTVPTTVYAANHTVPTTGRSENGMIPTSTYGLSLVSADNQPADLERRRVAAQRLKKVNMQTFTGQAHSLHAWLESLELYCNLTGVPVADRSRVALYFLSPDTILSLGLGSADVVPTNYAEFRDYLLLFYFGADRNTYYLQAVQEAKQNAGESIEAFVSRLRQLVKHANQRVQQITPQMEIAQFIAGIADPLVSSLVARDRNIDLHSSSVPPYPPLHPLEHYVRLASYSAPVATAHARAAYHPGQSTHSAMATVPLASSSAYSPAYSRSVGAPLAAASVAATTPVLSSTSVDPAPPTAPRSPPFYKHPDNHAAPHRKEQKRASKPSPPAANRFAVTCFNCMLQGHGTRDCPKPRNDTVITANRIAWQNDRDKRRFADLDKRIQAIVESLPARSAPQVATASSSTTLN